MLRTFRRAYIARLTRVFIHLIYKKMPMKKKNITTFLVQRRGGNMSTIYDGRTNEKLNQLFFKLISSLTDTVGPRYSSRAIIFYFRVAFFPDFFFFFVAFCCSAPTDVSV